MPLKVAMRRRMVEIVSGATSTETYIEPSDKYLQIYNIDLQMQMKIQEQI